MPKSSSGKPPKANHIVADQPLLAVETDKAVVEISRRALAGLLIYSRNSGDHIRVGAKTNLPVPSMIDVGG